MRLKDGKLVNTEVRIETTNSCNARCVMCPREKMTRQVCEMGMMQFATIIDEVVDLGAETISLFGYGEPLMDGNIVERIRYCANRGLKTFITTNAALLNYTMAKDLVDAGLSDIRFSVHGLTANRYESVHRGLDFSMALRNIHNFLAINKMDGNTSTHVSSICMNGDDPDKIRYAWEEAVDYLEIWKPHNWAGGRKYRKVERRKKTCGRPFNGPLQINADGKMMVCCFDYNGEMIIGHTVTQGIARILETSTALEEIRKAHKTGQYGSLPCAECDQLNEEDESPLLYSNRDKTREVGKTSSCKFKLQEDL